MFLNETKIKRINEVFKSKYPIIPTSTIERARSTVKPPKRGHFGNGTFVLSSEVVLFSEVV